MHLSSALDTRLTARVAYSEVLGAETLIHLKAADDTHITVRQDAGVIIPDEGSETGLSWDISHELRFDGAGKRVVPPT